LLDVTELEYVRRTTIDSDESHGFASLALLYTLPRGRPVWGVAALDDQLFVLREGTSHVEVYRCTTLEGRLQVPGLAAARDLAACHVHACIYVTDVGNKDGDGKAEPKRRYAVHRSVCILIQTPREGFGVVRIDRSVSWPDVVQGD